MSEWGSEADRHPHGVAGGGRAGESRPADPTVAHPATRTERAIYAGVRFAALGLAKLWARLTVVGRERLPAHGPFILAPVHRSNLDFLLTGLANPGRMRYMTKDSVWKSKALGRVVEVLGGFPVHRGSADREALRICMRVIENGEPLVMFPEGTRRSGPDVKDMFDGAAYVAARTGVPLVPLGIGGSEQAMPQGSKLVKPRKIALVVGDPIHPPKGDGTGRVPRRVVRELTGELRDAIQAHFDEATRLAG